MPKQEYETCLYGAEMGPKDAPRICLRGKLDALHAKAVLCATDIAEQGDKMCIRDSRRIELVEAAAENDDELLEKYFNGDTLSTEEVLSLIHI